MILKKLFSILLTVAMLCFFLTSCNLITSSTQSTSETSQSSESVQAQEDITSDAQSATDESATEESTVDESDSEDLILQAYTTSVDDILERGTLIIGVDENFAPMTYKDESGNYAGFDIDLAKAICAHIGVTPEFVSINWAEKENMLNAGKIDCIISGLSVTNERQQSINLTGPYFRNILSIVSTFEIEIRSETDLVGLRIGVQAASSSLEALKGSPMYTSFEPDIILYDDYEAAYNDLIAHNLDCMIVDEVFIMNKMATAEVSFGTSPMDYGDDYYAVGTRKADMELSMLLDTTLAELKESGVLSQLSTDLFGTDIYIV